MSPIFSAFKTLLSKYFARPSSIDLTELELVDELNEAIRAGDAKAVSIALQNGASPNGCTYDRDGFHTPLELAINQRNTDVIQLLQQARITRLDHFS